jgi:sulfatase modifying factor 1
MVAPSRFARLGRAAAAIAVLSVGIIPSTEPGTLTVSSVTELPGPRPLRDWRVVDGKGWQLVGSRLGEEAPGDAVGLANGICPQGMLEVSGNMKSEPFEGAVEELQKEACVHWIQKTYPERCAAYDPERWKSLSRELPTRPMHFCIDRFEYPNEQGSYPIVMVTWSDANRLCEERGERLCTEDEWTFACEARRRRPSRTATFATRARASWIAHGFRYTKLSSPHAPGSA